MTALCCVDTRTRTFRRYIPQVHAGIRRARCTHEFEITRPQQDSLALLIDQVRRNIFPGMNVPLPEHEPEAA